VAVFIPCTTGTEAVFKLNSDPSEEHGFRVEAWDDAGNPYVAGANKLVAPNTFKTNKYTFDRLESVETTTGEADVRPGRTPILRSRQ
jgi:hypothetical protein